MKTSSNFVYIGILLGCVSCGSDASPLEGTTSSSATSTSTSGPGTGAGGGEGGAATAADCKTYCDRITEDCTEANSMYASDGACLDVCQAFPAGREGDTNSNSLVCRAFYLSSAVESPGDNCRYAGPGTEGKCGGSCENFCYLAQKFCNGEQAQWANEASCVQDCQQFSKEKEYVAGATGDNFACRLYELTQAADNSLNHCGNVGRESGACQDPQNVGGGGNGLGGGGLGGGGLGGGGSTASSTAATTSASSSATAVGAGGAGGGI